ncbi:MAG: single-stranded DNA-binding protein [Pseudomonadota bacterium]
MPSINKHIIVGNIGQTPEAASTKGGKSVANFSVATTATWKDKETGEKNERTEWHDVVAFGKLADICLEYADKGRQVYVEGESRTESWENDGTTQYRTKLYANEVQVLGANPSSA